MCHPPPRCVKHGSIRRLPHPSGLGRTSPASRRVPGTLCLRDAAGLGCCVGPSRAWGTPLACGTPGMRSGCWSFGFLAPRAGFWAARDALGKDRQRLCASQECDPNLPPPKAKAVGVSEFWDAGGGGGIRTSSKPTRQKGPVDSPPAQHLPTPHQRHPESWGILRTPPSPPRNVSKPHSPDSRGGMSLPGVGKRGPEEGWRGAGGLGVGMGWVSLCVCVWGGVSYLTCRTS